MSGTTSGTFVWSLSLSEILIDAAERCGKNFAELPQEFIRSGVRSLNLVLVAWANRGVNLWTVTEFVQYMPQGVGEYVVVPYIIDVLADSVILRQYMMGAPVSATPAFTTTLGSPLVTISGFSATPAAGQYINIAVVTSVGGILLNGFYKVVSVPGSGEATVTAASAATASVTAGGVVPSFTSTANSTTMAVSFPNHGLLLGQPFTVQVTTTVGGVNLLGPYPVASVSDANNFTFIAPYPAGSSVTVSENGGDALLATQSTAVNLANSAYPVDIQLYPLSRTDWMTIPNKFVEARPTSFWDDRQVSSVLHIWPLPNANGPYELRYRASTQIQDADIVSGQQLAVPYRFLEAFVSSLATHLSIKWSPERTRDLLAYSEAQWYQAANEDIEKVSAFLTPQMQSYFE